MGAPIRTMIGLLFVVVSAVVGLIAGVFWGAVVLNAIAYALFAMVLVLLYLTKPSHKLLIASLGANRDAFLTYHLFIRFPGASTLYSGLMNIFRIALLVWGGIAAWNGYYVLAGVSVAYFALTALYVARLDPYTYMRPAAEKGNEVAVEQLTRIERARTTYENVMAVSGES